jgi:hypothetical protein
MRFIIAYSVKDQIIQNINDPEMLERLFRKDKTSFMRDFGDATRGIDSELVRFWLIRLQSPDRVRKQTELKDDLVLVTSISVILALLVRLPMFLTSMTPEDFYLRNLCILIFSGLTTWFIIKNRITERKKILLLAFLTLGLMIFMNLLPEKQTDTTILAFMHIPVFMGFIFAMAYISFDIESTAKVSGFIRYCGELVIMTGLLIIAGAILSGMTIGMFEMIGMKIGQFYMENVGIIGLAILPVIAAWLIELNPGITERIAPVIARIFTPLVLIAAVIYLATLSISRISLSKNRDFLLIFNIMLLCVMAIIVFSLSELDKSDIRKLNIIMLFILVVVTLLIDLFALSAIITRLSDGFTPNRTVVLVSNLLILVNLLLLLPDLFLAGFMGKPMDHMEKIISRYLPVYFIYSLVVIFIFPVIF